MTTQLLKLVSWIFERVPYSVGKGLSWVIAYSAFSILRVRRKIVLENLQRVFGTEYTPSERKRIALNSYRHFALMLFEFIQFPALSQEDLTENIQISGLEHYQSAIAQNKGLIIISGHLGNWEYALARLHLFNHDVIAYARPIHNKSVNEWINSIRRSWKISTVGTRYSIRDIIQTLKQNKIIGFLIDQDAGRHGIFIDFLGQPASTYKGPAYCAIKSGTPILFFVVVRNKKIDYDFIIEPPFWVNPAKPMEEEIHRITKEITVRLEYYIRKYPEQYFWFHRRWKTKPSENPR